MLTKKNKFTDREYFQIYLSDPIPLQVYGTVKAHKLEKNHLMRTIVSTIGTSAYGISTYLVEIIQPTVKKIKFKFLHHLYVKRKNGKPNQLKSK